MLNARTGVLHLALIWIVCVAPRQTQRTNILGYTYRVHLPDVKRPGGVNNPHLNYALTRAGIWVVVYKNDLRSVVSRHLETRQGQCLDRLHQRPSLTEIFQIRT